MYTHRNKFIIADTEQRIQQPKIFPPPEFERIYRIGTKYSARTNQRARARARARPPPPQQFNTALVILPHRIVRIEDNKKWEEESKSDARAI